MQQLKPTTFALFFGNRGFFPGSLMAAARAEMEQVLRGLGHDVLMLDPAATRYGAVETPHEGAIFAEFLAQNRGKFGGVILDLPNFGDETGAAAALRDAEVPILIHAYPDDLTLMGNATRRDAFCGKISITDVLGQYGIKFTTLPPHTVSPFSSRFADNVAYFDRLCRVVNGMRRPVIGAIGSRTTAFKTVRYDEITLQQHGITVETLDLSQVIMRMKAVEDTSGDYALKAQFLSSYAECSVVPAAAMDNLVRLGVVLDSMIDEMGLDALALRCWTEMQEQLGISPCVLLSALNNSGMPAACEVDVNNAVAMHALSLASGTPAACLDWNNNYGDDDDKCILFHCGPVPASMMVERGTLGNHQILANAPGCSQGWGCNEGRIAPGTMTFGSLAQSGGKNNFYFGTGSFTKDPIPADYFGCAGVAAIPELQNVLRHVCRNGHRHHVSVTMSDVMAPMVEALSYYLGHEVVCPQQ